MVHVKKTRRDEICKLAQLLAPGGRFLPLSKELVEAAAAALKAAGLASADQYLNELKLMHIEAGFPLEPWLARTITLCKKSMARERGPVKRAPEMVLDNISDELWNWHGHVAVPGAVWAYAWGVCWMLREIELSKVCWSHVTWNQLRKTVRLFIAHSKMDQQGLGIARTLQCCGESPCWKGCAWFLLQNMLKMRDRRALSPEEHVFPNFKGKSLPSPRWWRPGGVSSKPA